MRMLWHLEDSSDLPRGFSDRSELENGSLVDGIVLSVDVDGRRGPYGWSGVQADVFVVTAPNVLRLARIDTFLARCRSCAALLIIGRSRG